jgi:hypothetical protein
MDCLKEILNVTADIVAIVTGILAAIFYFQFRLRKGRKRKLMEAYLKQQRDTGHPQRTVVHLMSKLKFTQDEVYQAGFASDHIFTSVLVAEGLATEVLFGYTDQVVPTN